MSLPLPNLITFSDYGNDWDRYLNALYSIYMDQLVNSGLTFNGLPIRYRYIPPTNGKGFGFWHLISEGENEEERVPALNRCERIQWIKWMLIEFGTNSDILWFESKRGSSINVVLWNNVYHYTVILGMRDDYYVLITAFPTSVGRERSFRKDLECFWRGKG